ncbi:Serine carboxypeptidase-like 26 [Ranunculus cassubicifolius]
MATYRPYLNLLLLLCSFVSSPSVKPCEAYSSTQESDRVTNLPGQPTSPNISLFSGYVTVNEYHGRALFYWFFEAQSQPSDKPLLLWFNGGPGCSSIGYGAVVELGPLRVTKNGDGLEFNSYAWNQEANLLFVESPVGVGFSYTNTSTDFTILDDAFVAEDAYNFLVNWLERFPQYKSHDFYISGESYAGHYVPQLAELVYDRNKNGTKYPIINLKGFIVGNPETDDYYDYNGLLDYAWNHAILSDQVYEHAKNVCDFKLFVWTDECNSAVNAVYDVYGEIDIYNIYAPTCLLKGGYDPCFEKYTEEYFNKVDVRLALHANLSGKWTICSDIVAGKFNYTVSSISPIYTKLINAGLKIWVYSGDADGRVPVTGSRYWIEAMGLPLKASWRSWYHKNQVGGRVVDYDGLTFVTVRGAGHLVPLNKGSESLALLHSYLSGEKLPSERT